MKVRYKGHFNFGAGYEGLGIKIGLNEVKDMPEALYKQLVAKLGANSWEAIGEKDEFPEKDEKENTGAKKKQDGASGGIKEDEPLPIKSQKTVLERLKGRVKR